MLREVRIHGALAQAVGRDVLHLEAPTPGHAVRLLILNRPDVRRVFELGTWVVRENGRSIDYAEMSVRRAQPRALDIYPAAVAAAMEGEGEKNAGLKILIGLLLVAGAVVTGGASLGLGFGFAAIPVGVAKFALTIGGALALGGVAQFISPGPLVDPDLAENAQDRQTYVMTGQTNVGAEGHALPLVFGRFLTGSITQSVRIENETTSNPWVEPATLVSAATGFFTEIIGEGPIGGLVNGAQSIYVEGTQAKDSQGGGLVPDISIAQVVGTGTPTDPGEEFNTVSRVANVGLLVENGSPVERDGIEPNATGATVTLAFPRLGDWSGSQLAVTSVTWQLEIDGGSGYTAVPVANMADSGRLSRTSVPPATPTALPGLTTQAIKINQVFNQGVDSDRPDEIEYTVRIRPVGATPWTEERTFFAPVIDSLIFGYDWESYYNDIRFEGLPSDQWEVEVFVVSPPVGSLTGNTSVDEHDTLTSFVTGGSSLEGFLFDVNVPDLSQYGAGPYKYRVTRVSAAPGTDIVNDFRFETLTESIKANFIHSHVAKIAWKAPSSEELQRIPYPRLYEVYGLQCPVPTGYAEDGGGSLIGGVQYENTWPDPWDGTWSSTQQWTDNPAFILRKILNQDRWGLGLDDATEIDSISIYEAAQRCDESVPVLGDPGQTEKRYSFNHVFTTQEEPARVLTLVTSAMHAQLWWINGTATVSQDRPGPVTRIFDDANVIGGFNYQGMARSARPTTVLTAWRDPDRLYEQQIDVYSRPLAADRFGHREVSTTLIGCTSRSMARRHSRYIVETSEVEDQVVTFTCGFQDALLTAGEIVSISDPFQAEIRDAGRIAYVGDLGSPLLNRDVVTVDMDTAAAWVGRVFRCTLEDGTIFQDTVSAQSGQTLTLGNPVTGTGTLANAMWMTTDSATAQLYRVASVVEKEPTKFEVTAHKHDPDKWTRIEDYAYDGAPHVFPNPWIVPFPAPSVVASAVQIGAEMFIQVDVTQSSGANADKGYVRVNSSAGVDVFEATHRADRSEVVTVYLGPVTLYSPSIHSVNARGLSRDLVKESALSNIDTVVVPAPS